MNKQRTVDSKVLSILRECPETRYDDMQLICEFAELCERNGHTVEPAGKEKAKSAKSKEKER